MITNICDINNALLATPTHKTLVEIADFGSRYLQEMQALSPEVKQVLHARLVTENYNNKELKSVIAVADQLFKEKTGEDLSALSPTARLHLFRYMEGRHLERPDYLLKLPKQKRERIFYRAFLTPLLKPALKGQELEAALKECIRALQKLPEKLREERLAQFKMCLEAFPAIEKGFGGLLGREVSHEKLVLLKSLGASFTDGLHLGRNLTYSLDAIARLKHFPLLELTALEISDGSEDALVMEIPSLSFCSSRAEFNIIQHIAGLPDVEKRGICSRFKKFTAAFPKLNSRLGFLLRSLKDLSDQKVDEVITFMKAKEPFVNLTSGAMMGYFIEKVVEGKRDFPFLFFNAAFPSLETNFAETSDLVTLLSQAEWVKTTQESFQKYGLDKLEITDGAIMAKILRGLTIEGCVSKNEIEPRFKIFAECLKAFPLIREYELIALEIPKLVDERRNTLELLMAARSSLPFSKWGDFAAMIAQFETLGWKQSLYWGGKAGLLDAFKRDVLSRFPAIKTGFAPLLQIYRSCQSEVWQFMENREPFSKITNGEKLKGFASFLQLDRFVSRAERDKLIHLSNRFVADFPWISFEVYFLLRLKAAPYLEGQLTLILKHFPDAPSLFGDVIELEVFLVSLDEVEENQRAGRLASIQKHLELASMELRNAYALLAIPADEQEHILTLFEKFDNFDLVRNYTYLVKDLSGLDRSEREALIAKISHADDLEKILGFPKNIHPFILLNLQTCRELASQIDITTTLLLMPCDLLRACVSQENFMERLASEENREAISNHLILLLEKVSEEREGLKKFLPFAKNIAQGLRLGDEESPLGDAILRYEILLADRGAVTPWTIYKHHKERLNALDKLPLPPFDGGYFNYEALAAAKEITPETLPKGINLAKLKALTAAFVERYNHFDEGRKGAIVTYLRTVLPGFVTVEKLVNGVNDPWWDYHLRASLPISQVTWRLFHAVDYMSKESTVAGTELPGHEDTPANFALREKLLSPQESALLKLLGQVQNCDSGKEWGLEIFSGLLPSMRLQKRGRVNEKISGAVRGYLQQIVYRDTFLRKVLDRDNLAEPLHYAKYICNALGRELGFTIKFDLNARITSELQKKTPQEFLTALFQEVQPTELYKKVLDALGGLDWSSAEGVELFNNLKRRVPPNELHECCTFDEDGMLDGITLKAIPYLLKQYGFI